LNNYRRNKKYVDFQYVEVFFNESRTIIELVGHIYITEDVNATDLKTINETDLRTVNEITK